MNAANGAGARHLRGWERDKGTVAASWLVSPLWSRWDAGWTAGRGRPLGSGSHVEVPGPPKGGGLLAIVAWGPQRVVAGGPLGLEGCWLKALMDGVDGMACKCMQIRPPWAPWYFSLFVYLVETEEICSL